MAGIGGRSLFVLNILRLLIEGRFPRLCVPTVEQRDGRFIQTALREWAYAKHLTDSEQSDAHLQSWIDYYNRERPHGGLGYKPPISRSDTGTTS